MPSAPTSNAFTAVTPATASPPGRGENGDILWQSEKLLYRGLSGALVVGTSVVFGDSEGYVHFLDSKSGDQQLRLSTDGNAVIGTPLLAGQTMLVTTQGRRRLRLPARTDSA